LGAPASTYAAASAPKAPACTATEATLCTQGCFNGAALRACISARIRNFPGAIARGFAGDAGQDHVKNTVLGVNPLTLPCRAEHSHSASSNEHMRLASLTVVGADKSTRMATPPATTGTFVAVTDNSLHKRLSIVTTLVRRGTY
jgi:hypothetical protein